MADTCFEAGNRCLLFLMKERFLVSLLEVDESTVRVTFPTRDIPVEGMYVKLEFHDHHGYTSYETEILKTPEGAGDGLVLRRPFEMTRTHHRSAWRAPVDFDASVKSHVHPRRHTCPAINISLGGMLLTGSAAFEYGETVEVTFALPGAEAMNMTAKIVHTVDAPAGNSAEKLIGLEFISPDPVYAKAISLFVARSVRDRYPGAAKN